MGRVLVMLRITKSMSSEGAVSYFDNALHRTDYYAKEVGAWGGKGAELLGLQGEVDRKAFAALAQNKKPGTGERLTARTNTTGKEKGTEESVANRRAGYDFTFSVPKSVSLYLAFNEDRRVEQMIAEALDEAMREIEARMETKVRKGYRQENRVSPNMVYAKFVHRETRPVDGIPDPHYHVHVFVFNATLDPVEQQWKALEVGNIVGDRPYYEAIFHARLADRLIAAGYGIRRTDRDFELAGVTRELIEKFSKRTQLIEQIAREKYTVLEAKARALMKQSGMAFEDAFAQVKSELGLLSREKKNTARLSHEEQLENWRGQMMPDELESLRPENVRGTDHRHLLERKAAGELSISHLFERRSVARPLHAAAMLLRRGIGKVSVQEGLEFANGWRFVTIGKLVTTTEVLVEERAMIQMARAGQDRYEALGKGREWKIRDERVAGDDGQAGALRHVLDFRDLVTSIRGPAGAGKSTLMPEAVRALEALSGKAVLVLAPSSSSVEVLKGEGFQRSETFQKFEADPMLQNAAQGAVIWVDEAGFLGAKQMRWLLDYAGRNDCRVILSGDVRQHHAVDRGDAMRVLERTGAVRQVALSKIYRQQIPELQAAVKHLADGKTQEGFEKLDSFGVIKEIQDQDERLESIAGLQLEAIRDKRTSLIVAPTHAECRQIAGAVRSRLKKERLLEKEDRAFTRLEVVDFTESQRRDAINYRAGQIIEFHHRAKGGFKVGQQWEVTSVADGVVRVIPTAGKSKRVLEAPVNGVGRSGGLVLPLEVAKSFQVFEARTVELAIGDQVRATKNVGACKNNQLYWVVEIMDGHVGLVSCKGGDKRLRVLTDRALHIDQGIAATSHASQGKTVGQVIASAPVSSFAQVNQAQFYVSMSRARHAMYLYTDSKAALKEAVMRPSERLSVWELLDGAKKDRALKAELDRQRAKEQNREQTYER